MLSILNLKTAYIMLSANMTNHTDYTAVDASFKFFQHVHVRFLSVFKWKSKFKLIVKLARYESKIEKWEIFWLRPSAIISISSMRS